MSKDCLSNVNNYANSGNSVVLPNSLTCRFSWLYNESLSEFYTLDFSTIPEGDSIASVSVDITDGTTTVNGIGTTDVITIDVSTLINTVSWRIDYTVTTTNGLTCTITYFFDPTDREYTTGSSDPNFNPAPLPPFFADPASIHPVQVYEIDFIAPVATWTMNHNTGNTYPLSIELYDISNARLFTGVNIIDSNSLSVTFGSPRAGRAKLIFVNP